MATKKAKSKKDLDPKGKSAEVKGGRGNLLDNKKRDLVRKVVGKATGAGKAIRDI